jgi:hypothetical protein
VLVSTGELYHVHVDFALLASSVESVVLECLFRVPHREIMQFRLAPGSATRSIAAFAPKQEAAPVVPKDAVRRNFRLGTTAPEDPSMINWMSINGLGFHDIREVT